ncbi:MAG: DUF389 domain-containing protein [Bacteroidales bacterium]|nr:DUF389 domain-containing protein [Bacteroidales bacterium]
MPMWDTIKQRIRSYLYIYEDVDTVSAAERIKSAIWFKGPNAWILAFAIVLASVGLNVNSTAVIIGAMLVSPLMGPIIGTGLALGTNDTDLLKSALKNLLVMVGISLLASTLFFILSPLSLVNPTELEARTSPTIYDVMIAFFGGLAGILENSRKERGTVLSGVAIATALMPPLCTAGYGLAHMNMHFFLGALYLFVINSVFIALATYLMVKYLRFQTVSGISTETAIKRRRIISAILTIVVVPSIWSAIVLIGNNNFERNVGNFVENNRLVGRSYIYDYKVEGRKVNISFAGEPLTDSLRADFFARANSYRLKEARISITEHNLGMTQTEMNNLLDQVYTRAEQERAQNQAALENLQTRLDSLLLRIDALEAFEALFELPADSLAIPDAPDSLSTAQSFSLPLGAEPPVYQ